MNILDKISNIGLTGNEDGELLSRVILTNRVIFITVLMTALYIPLALIFKLEGLYPAIISLFVISTPFIFTKFRYFQTAAIVLVFYSSIQVLYLSCITVIGSGHMFLLAVFIYNLTLVKNVYIKWVLGALIISCYFFVDYYLYHYRIENPQEYQNEKLFFIISTVLVFITCFYTIFHFKITNLGYEKEIIRKNKLIAVQHEKLDSAIVDINASIKYAKRIQTAIFPPRSLIKRYLKNSDILYEPKGVISGDFYWTEVCDDRILFAVADCTGQGVPGAMISFVCNNALNRAVKEFNLLDPAEILEKTREIIIDKFESVGNNMMDGMDIALVSIPLNDDKSKASEIKYAGANCPLYIVRQGHLEAYAPDKQPIGHYHSPFAFTTRTIKVEEGDMIYIFTDGYASQFGGPQGKKIKYRRFRNLLKETAVFDTETQRGKLIKFFEDWQGDYDQVDDICIIAVRI